MKATALHLLFTLSKHSIKSSGSAAQLLGVSQQTASRWLSSLAVGGYAEKTKQGYYATAKGKAYLQSIAEPAPANAFRGKVFTGVGEGAYYLSRPGYKKQFRALGFEPFPGTLNLRLPPEQVPAAKALRDSAGIVLKGFKEEQRTFGDVKCFHATVMLQGGAARAGADRLKRNKSIRAAIVFPGRAHYADDVLEVVASVNLRRKLKLKDGDEAVVALTSSI